MLPEDSKTLNSVTTDLLTLEQMITIFENTEGPEARTAVADAVMARVADELGTPIVTAQDVADIYAGEKYIPADRPWAVPTDWLWNAMVDMVDQTRNAYPWATMTRIVVAMRDTKRENVAALCGECAAYIVNGETPYDDDDAAALAAFVGEHNWMHSGSAPADELYGEQCECCGAEFWDQPRIEVFEHGEDD